MINKKEVITMKKTKKEKYEARTKGFNGKCKSRREKMVIKQKGRRMKWKRLNW